MSTEVASSVNRNPPKLTRVCVGSHAERYPSGPSEGWLWLRHGQKLHYFGSEKDPVSKCGKFRVLGLPMVGNYNGEHCPQCERKVKP